LHCSWCDSGFTWDASRYDLRAEATRATVADIFDRALAGSPGLVVITGGEPLLHQHQPGWQDLLRALRTAEVDIEIETNGTVVPAPLLLGNPRIRFNVSPKLAHASDPEHRRIVPAALAALRDSHRAVFKFVCRGPGDVPEAARIAAEARIPPRTVWIMPEGVTPATVTAGLAAIADTAVEHGFNVTTRLHILCWGNERGR
jgi:organic radical activating enzyme